MADTPDEISPATPSTKPYFLRALYEWCTDNGFTPYLAVAVDSTTRVPNEYVKDGQIVLNVSFDATSNLKISNDSVSFAARFGGVAREINVPVERIAAIYARENGQGMGFEVTETGAGSASATASAAPEKQPVSGAPALAVAAPMTPAAIGAAGAAKLVTAIAAAVAAGPSAVPADPPADGSSPKAAPEPPKKGGKPKFTVVK